MTKNEKLLLVTISIFICSITFGQTKLYLIGGIHNGSPGYTSDTIYNILVKTQADIVLYEADSLFFNEDFTLRTDLWKNMTLGLDGTACTKYQKENGGILRPFDIEGRNDFYWKNQYGTKEPEMMQKIDSLFTNKLLSEKDMEDIEFFFTTFYLTSLRGYTLEEVNSPMFRKLNELKHNIVWDLNVEIVKNSPELEEYVEFAEIRRDFWIKRNDAMVKNILFWCEEYKDQTIVVLTGAEHLYYLYNNIEEVAEEKNIEIIEYWK